MRRFLQNNSIFSTHGTCYATIGILCIQEGICYLVYFSLIYIKRTQKILIGISQYYYDMRVLINKISTYKFIVY